MKENYINFIIHHFSFEGLKKTDWQIKDGRGLRAEAMAGLSPRAVSCIPPDVFKVVFINDKSNKKETEMVTLTL